MVSIRLNQKLLFSKLKVYFEKLVYSTKILDTLSYKNTLSRGFVLIKSIKDSKPIESVHNVANDEIVEIEFFDGNTDAKIMKPSKKNKKENNEKLILVEESIQEKLL